MRERASEQASKEGRKEVKSIFSSIMYIINITITE